VIRVFLTKSRNQYKNIPSSMLADPPSVFEASNEVPRTVINLIGANDLT
jgi:hypothetical protein